MFALVFSNVCPDPMRTTRRCIIAYRSDFFLSQSGERYDSGQLEPLLRSQWHARGSLARARSPIESLVQSGRCSESYLRLHPCAFTVHRTATWPAGIACTRKCMIRICAVASAHVPRGQKGRAWSDWLAFTAVSYNIDRSNSIKSLKSIVA